MCCTPETHCPVIFSYLPQDTQRSWIPGSTADADGAAHTFSTLLLKFSYLVLDTYDLSEYSIDISNLHRFAADDGAPMRFKKFWYSQFLALFLCSFCFLFFMPGEPTFKG